jgi:hypothetical protein
MSDHFDPTSTNGRAFLKEFLKPMGWRYGAALLFWDSKGQFTGQLAAIRTGKQGDFTDSEMDYLRELHPQMESVIHRLFALENAFAAHLSLEHSLGALPLPIMVVGWDERLNYCNKAATEAIADPAQRAENERAMELVKQAYAMIKRIEMRVEFEESGVAFHQSAEMN